MKLKPISIFLAGLLLGISTTSIAASSRGSSFFPDVPFGAWFDEPIGEMRQLGIIKGNDDGTFRPEAPVSRAEVAVMFKRFRDELLGITPVEESQTSSVRSRVTRAASSSSAAPLPDTNENGKVRFTVASFSILENRSEATVTIVRNEGKTGDISVKYKTENGTATAGEDFDQLSGILDFRDGQSSATINVSILNDTDAEGNETFKLVLSDPTGGSELGSITETVVTITDDESTGSTSTSGGSTATEAGLLTLSAKSYAVMEDSGTVTVTVERTGGTTGAVTVDYSTSHGTADTSSYTPTNGTLSFGNGETSKTFTVSLVDNNSIGGNKTVNLSISAPTGGAGLGHYRTSVLTITDDEVASSGAGSLKFGATSFTVGSSTGEAEIVITRSGGTDGTVGITYSTTDGTGISGRDYSATSGTLSFLPGESQKAFFIPLLSGGDGSVNLRLESPTGGASIASPSTASLIIE